MCFFPLKIHFNLFAIIVDTQFETVYVFCFSFQCKVYNFVKLLEQTRKQLFEASRHYEKDISYEQAIHRECLHAWFQRPLTQFLLTLDVEAIEGAPLSQISAKHYDPSADMEGFSGSNHFVVNGLSQILDRYEKGFLQLSI